MKTKIEIKSVIGSLLFEYEEENNTLKETLEVAARKQVNLQYANLSNATLQHADLSGIRLANSDLSGASLCNTNLSGAKLTFANLHRADLYKTDLTNANLYAADLSRAYIIYTNLEDADLEDADLSYSILDGAILDNAFLCDADFHRATFRRVNLQVAKDLYIPTYLPEGEFIAWKKLPNGLIVKLKILEDSKRSRATGDKCRCDKALVLEFQNKDGSKSDIKKFTNREYAPCTYKVGEVVYADSWDDNRWEECSHGIHFFIDRQSAVNYY